MIARCVVEVDKPRSACAEGKPAGAAPTATATATALGKLLQQRRLRHKVQYETSAVASKWQHVQDKEER